MNFRISLSISEGKKNSSWNFDRDCNESVGFPSGISSKEPTCQCRRLKRCGFSPLGQEDPLEEGMATHSSTLAWRIPRTEEPGGCRPWDGRDLPLPQPLSMPARNDPEVSLGSVRISTTPTLPPISEHVFPLVCIFFNSQPCSVVFSVCIFHLFKLIPKYFILFDAIMNGTVFLVLLTDYSLLVYRRASLVAQMVKNVPAMKETQV